MMDCETIDAVRAAFAHAALDAGAIPPTLGCVTLHHAQQAAASRLETLLRRDRGAVLADPVGRGKTYTALAVAARCGPAMIIAPSSLRGMWAEALSACSLEADVVTHESLSRGRRPVSAAPLIIVDEAHRFRSPGTHRYALLADLCREREVLLLSATPVQNRRADLSALIGLFLGRSAWQMNDDELSRHVVRAADERAGLPEQRGPFLLSVATTDDACLEQLLAIPAPVPARDESVAAALLVYGLLHQWSSSRAALVAALRRRQSRGVALLDSLETGRLPTRQELAAWTHCGDAVQLAFPEIVSAKGNESLDTAPLLLAVDRHAAAVTALLRTLRATPDPDDERARLLRRVRADHPGERVIAFCQYTETVNALRERLAHDPGVAALTAHGARVAGGRLPRESVLAQFRPGTRDTPAAERIELLLTTDLLSEGLNLQEASVIVHLDFPWNPARLDQRVGRARRLGSRHSHVTVYAFAPPAAAEQVLRVEERLREKLRVAQRAIGVAGRILPSRMLSPLSAAETSHGAAETRGALDSRLRTWVKHSPAGTPLPESRTSSTPRLYAVSAPGSGLLCALRGGESAIIVADIGSGIRDDPDTVAHAIELLDRATGMAPIDSNVADRALARLRAWIEADRGAASIDFAIAAAARHRRRALERVSQALARAPRHRRAALADLAAAARQVALAPLGEGAERILESLVSAELPDEAWLRSVAMFGALNARPRGEAAPRRAAEIGVVILFVPPPL